MLHPENNGHWYDKILNSWPFLVDDQSVKTIGIAWIFKENGKWNRKPRITGNHQFYNAMFFLRIGLPLALFTGIRLTSTRLVQCGIGWKQNGRIAILFRVQTDASAAAGSHPGIPNTDQTGGWDYGLH